MKKFIENHRRGIILSAVCLPFLSIIVLALALLGNTNQLFQEYSMAWYCLAQLSLTAVATTATRSGLQKLMLGCSLLLLVMAVPINYVIAVAIPGILLLVFGMLRLYKPVSLLVAFTAGVVVMTSVECVAEGMSFAVTSIAFLLGFYIVGWGIYMLSGLVDRLPEPLKRFVSEVN